MSCSCPKIVPTKYRLSSVSLFLLAADRGGNSINQFFLIRIPVLQYSNISPPFALSDKTQQLPAEDRISSVPQGSPEVGVMDRERSAMNDQGHKTIIRPIQEYESNAGKTSIFMTLTTHSTIFPRHSKKTHFCSL